MAEKYKKVYAVDFDGTLCRGTRFPKIGTPNFYLFEFLKEKQKEGYTGGDIVKVYRITPESLGCIEDVFIKSNLELIWERTETKKMTIEEMRQKLEELTGEEIEVTA